MKIRKKLTPKDWLASVLVIFLLITAIALPAKLFSKNSESDEPSDTPIIDVPTEDDDVNVDVDVNGVRLNKTEITF